MLVASDLRSQASHCAIRINGSDLDSASMAQMTELLVEQDLSLPGAFAIHLMDIEPLGVQGAQSVFSAVDSQQFALGAEVEIFIGREEGPRSVLKGEITTFEIDASAPGRTGVIVRGYDAAYRLHRARHTHAFVNQTDSDIATHIAAENGLIARVDATSTVYPHVVQDNQTDLEFLLGRARRIGFEAYVDDRQLVFRKPEAVGTSPRQTFGETLTQIRLRMSGPNQVQTARIQDWNPVLKQATVGSASQPVGPLATPPNPTGSPGNTTTRQLGQADLVITGAHARTQEDATLLAQAAMEDIAAGFIQLEATCLGEPSIRPGKPVELFGIGQRFSGTYYPTAVHHRFTTGRGYMTSILVTGREPSSLAGLLARPVVAPAASGHVSGGYPGVVVGVVTNNKVPTGEELEGQVKVAYPWLPESVESGWARLATPMASSKSGFFWLPEVGDEVLVAFEHGDINRPYVIGAVWNGKDTPPSAASTVVGPAGRVDKRIIRSRTGHIITIDDSEEAPGVSIVDKTGHNSLKFDSMTNSFYVKVDGDITLEAANKINLTGGEIALGSNRTGISLEAQTDLKLKGLQTEVEGTTQVKVKGATADIGADALVNVHGALVKLN